MKTLFFAALAAGLALTACNSKSTETAADQNVDSAAVEQTVATDTVAAQADTAALANAVVEITTEEVPVPTADKAVVIDFSATWCGPCQKFKPIYHQVAGEYASKATFYSADLDDLPELAKKFNVTSIPCIVILKAGAEPVSQVGYMEESDFKALLDKNI